MKQKFVQILLIIAFPALIQSKNYKILESTSTFIKVSFDFSNEYNLRDTLVDGKLFTYISGEDYSLRKPGEPWLPNVYLNVGIPYNSKPFIKILQIEQENYPQRFIIPLPDSGNQDLSSLKFDESIYSKNILFPEQPVEINSVFSMRYATAAGISISPYQFNPITRELFFNKKVTFRIDYNSSQTIGAVLEPLEDILTNDFVNNSVVNPNEAKNFIKKIKDVTEKRLHDTSWYNPQKTYYKMYLNRKGVYRVTFESLISAGISPFGAIQEGLLELINNGLQVPLDIADVNLNGLFDSSDYFQFIGHSPTQTSPFTFSNIYNTENIYWFSYSADSVFKYKYIDGYPTTIDTVINTVLETTHYEEDKIYEPLGYALDDQRDFWFWDKAEAQDGVEKYIFKYDFNSFAPNINPNFPFGSVRANLHGMTLSGCNPGHSAFLKFNGIKMGGIQWSNQQAATISKDFVFSFFSYHPDSVRWLQSGNYFEIGC